jgi:uncharacterized peroxidase-related enzyme
MKPWIKTVDVDDARGDLAGQYSAAIARAGKVFNIVRVMSLKPEQMRDSMAFYRTLMFGKSGLSRAERELAAVIVSQANKCHY